MNSYKATLSIDPTIRLSGGSYPTVTAIKLLRSFTNLSLKEAKYMIDVARDKVDTTRLTIILSAEQLGDYHALVNHGTTVGESEDCYTVYPNDLLALGEITPYTDTATPMDMRRS